MRPCSGAIGRGRAGCTTVDTASGWRFVGTRSGKVSRPICPRHPEYSNRRAAPNLDIPTVAPRLASGGCGTQPLDEPRPARAPTAAGGEHRLGRLAERDGSVMGVERLALNDEAVV